MNGLSDKLKLIFKPFLIIAICFIATYTFLHWVLFIKAEIPLKADIVKFWLPFGLPFIPILIWLRPRIKLLNFKNENASFGYQFLACIAIAIPTIIAQEYLVTATGKLTKVDNISQIEKSEKTKYYSLKNYYIDKQHIAVQNTATVTGRNNTDFNMLIYVAMPIFDNISDTLKTQSKFWLGKKYSEKISNSLSDQEKDDKYKVFVEQKQKEFDETNFKDFKYLEIIGNTEDHDEFNNAISKSENIKGKEQIVFEAQNEPFDNRNGKKMEWIFGSLGIGLLVYFLSLLFPKFNEQQLENFKKGKVEKDNDIKEILEFFIPKDDFFITPIIINLNLLVFIVMVIAGFGFLSFKGNDLLNWGANYRPITTDGQWWRLLTNTFMHGGLMHILANMYGLLFVGVFLEPLLGKTKYLLVYLITGILASVTSILWYPASISIGASGAVFGLYGFFLAALLLKVFPPDFGKAFLLSTLVFVGFNLLMGFTGGIDNAAHIGGLLSGFIIGMIMSKKLKLKIEQYNKE
ncbi:membrane associated rhomboid family serine protease [Chryseobacterium sp. 52]|uniref:rhomboid family intramembrane serine protease n=1 Tax=Chryseobacterium sp. 52 TaxID=2035213 RepID=UPI000C19C5B6|nr:rhomboid family intramembrane serine protease [Chryseobacterium sp. 52]PIF45257.1 membrane associated rhomboid family serine protease [Chryseobacterium sp. 52]